MNKLIFVTTVALVCSVCAANAASNSVALGTGFNIGGTQTNTAAGAAALGNAAATSQQAGVNTSIGTGFAVATPLGGLSASAGTAIGQSQGLSAAAAAGPGGLALTSGHVINVGNGNGIGFTNVTP